MRTGARSGSPLAEPAAVKTCAREPGGFPARASPGRCSTTARRRRTSRDASGIRVGPGSSLKLAFLRGRNPTRDLPPCQRAAPWCAVTSRASRLASREPGSRRFESVSPARVTRSPGPNGTDPGGRRSSRRCERALEGARGFLETGVDAPACFDPGQRCAAWGRLLSYTLASLEWRGLSAAPGAPEGSQQLIAGRHVPRHASFSGHANWSATSLEPQRGG